MVQDLNIHCYLTKYVHDFHFFSLGCCPDFSLELQTSLYFVDYPRELNLVMPTHLSRPCRFFG